MKTFLMLSLVLGLIAGANTASAQNDAPKPSVTVQGTATYLGKPADNIVVSLTKLEEPKKDGEGLQDKAEEPKPVTSTTNEKGEFEFKNVPIGKYRLTAKGRPANSLRAFKEADPVDVEITTDTASPVVKAIKLTLDKAK